MNRKLSLMLIACAALPLAACNKKPTEATQQTDAMAHQHAGDAPVASPAEETFFAVSADALLAYLYVEGFKVVPLEDKDWRA